MTLKSNNPNMDWCRFIPTADEFLICYAMTPLMLGTNLFLVGHAAELYLKAVLTKQTGDIDKAVNFDHDVKGLILECQKNDPKFLPGIDYIKLEKDREYRRQNFSELYSVGKYLADLKYLGVTKSEGIEWGTLRPNSDWVSFFKHIRNYLQYPPQGYRDWLKDHPNSGEIPAQAKRYFEGI